MCVFSLLIASRADAAEVAHRVVSANLCADELLLALADPEQIISLSPFAADPEMSFLADKAKRHPSNRGVGEDLVRLQADLVLVGPYDNRYTRDLLAAQGLRFLSLAPWASFADGQEQIRDLADRLGHPERGEALVAEIIRALDSIRGAARTNGQSLTSLILHRRGYIFHAGITGEIVELAGFEDAAPSLGVGEAGFVKLERLISHRPDYLIVADNSDLAVDQGQALLTHPALTEFFPLERRLVLPDRLTICGGPSTLALVKAFAAEIAKKIPR